jgi:hypothetical protein
MMWMKSIGWLERVVWVCVGMLGVCMAAQWVWMGLG